MRRRKTASGNFVRKLPCWIRCATLLPDFLHVIAGRQNLSACFVGDGNIGNQAGIEGLFPDRSLGRQVRADLPVAIEKRVRHEPLSQIKTPPAIAITDGAFELIFPVDFSFPELSARFVNARGPTSFPAFWFRCKKQPRQIDAGSAGAARRFWKSLPMTWNYCHFFLF
jgi:hypothetical protein